MCLRKLIVFLNVLYIKSILYQSDPIHFYLLAPRNLEFSSRVTTQNWAREVLKDLKSVEKCNDAFESYSVGFGMGFRIMGVKAGIHICTHVYIDMLIYI
jgi:hypothetical protein